jgi:hypothetical protein
MHRIANGIVPGTLLFEMFFDSAKGGDFEFQINLGRPELFFRKNAPRGRFLFTRIS